MQNYKKFGLIHKKRRIAGGGFINEMYRHTKSGIVHMGYRTINGIRRLVPILEKVGSNVVIPVAKYMPSNLQHQGVAMAQRLQSANQGGAGIQLVSQNALRRGGSVKSKADVLQSINMAFNPKKSRSRMIAQLV